jgi:hypothetical protein
MSAFDAAKKRDSEAFDDLLGQLVDELAMSPVSAPQPDPAPQVAPAPAPHGQFTPTDFHGATNAAANYAPPRAKSIGPTIAIAGIVAAAVVTLGLAAMFILPGDGDEVAAADPAPAAPVEEVSIPVAAPAPTPPPVEVEPVPVVVPVADQPKPAAEAKSEAKTTSKPVKKPPKKRPPKKTPPKKTPPKKTGDSFDDM